MAEFLLNPRRPAKLSPQAAARLDAMTPAEIEANAASDLDNPPLTDAELATISAARLAKAAREVVGLSQVQFASTYRINVARLRDLERGRFRQPDSALIAYLTVIRSSPETVRKALEAAD
jgi:putative transcriptional regulator